MLKKIKKIVIENKIILYLIISLYFGGIISMVVDSIFSSYDIAITINVVKALKYNIKNPFGVIAVIIIFSFIYVKNQKNNRHDQDDFKYSKKGTHGTAGLMTDEELGHFLKQTDTVEQTSGTILGERDGKVISLKQYEELEGIYKDYALNNFFSVAGGPGKGKTQVFGLPYIFKLIEREESAIIFDTKGDYYTETSNLAQSKGYNVKRISFKPESFKNSDAWDLLAYIKIEDENVAELRVDEIVNILMKTTEEKGSNSSQFFTDGLNNLLVAGFLYVGRSLSYKGERTIGACFNLLIQTPFEILNMMFKALPSDDPAIKSWQTFARKEAIATDVLTNLGTRFAILKSKAVQEILSRDEIDIELLGKEKCMYYVIIDDQSKAFKPVVSIFAKTCIKRLVTYADSLPGSRLMKKVTLYMEEFPSSVKIPEFEDSIATIRSRGIGAVIVYQNISQMKNKFPDSEWEAILNNCDININLGLGASDTTTAKYLSERTGVATTGIESKGEQRGTFQPEFIPTLGYNKNESDGKRVVMLPDEILRMPLDTLLLIISGHNVAKLKKIKAVNHKIYEELVKYGKANLYDYVPKWRKEQEEAKEQERIRLEEFRLKQEEKGKIQQEESDKYLVKDIGDKFITVNYETGEVVHERLKESGDCEDIFTDLFGNELNESDFTTPKKRGRKQKK